MLPPPRGHPLTPPAGAAVPPPALPLPRLPRPVSSPSLDDVLTGGGVADTPCSPGAPLSPPAAGASSPHVMPLRLPPRPPCEPPTPLTVVPLAVASAERARVLPGMREDGWSLAEIFRHYEHRAAVRVRVPALLSGAFTPLRAFFRGAGAEGGGARDEPKVLAFSRSLPGSCVAVVACSMESGDVPTQFMIGAEPLAAAFGVASGYEHGNPMLWALNGAVAFGDALAARRAAGHAEEALTLPALATLTPSCAVWEVRDAFRSAAPPSGVLDPAVGMDTRDGAPAAATVAARARAHFFIRPLTPPPSPLPRAGPLVAVVSAVEAALSPTLTELPASRSLCWVHSPLVAAAEPRGSPLRMGATRWLFASALARLAAALDLKELRGAPALLSHGDVGARGERFAEAAAAAVSGTRLSSVQAVCRAMPWRRLADGELIAVLRHNAIFALLAETARRLARLEGALGPAPAPRARAEAVRAGAREMGAVLRVMALHLGVVEGAGGGAGAFSTVAAGGGTPALGATPLPPLASLRPAAADAEAAAPPPPAADAWYAVNPEVAAVLLRAALFLALAAGAPGADKPLGAFAMAALGEFLRSHNAEGAAGAGVGAAAAAVEGGAVALGKRLAERSALGPVVLLTPELKSFFTTGGLGTMVEELAEGLAELGQQVVVIAPYYNKHEKKNRVGKVFHASDFFYGSSHWAKLAPDCGFHHKCNVHVRVGDRGTFQLGVHEGMKKKVRLLFLHNEALFPELYPRDLPAAKQLTSMVGFAKGALEVLCQLKLTPSVVLTNDWFTALAPAYARRAFGDAFQGTDFLSVIHNLDEDYQGRLYPTIAEGKLHHIHELSADDAALHLLVNGSWGPYKGTCFILNASRCALLTADNWATVSKSYREEISVRDMQMELRLARAPFAFSNGIPSRNRVESARKKWAEHEKLGKQGKPMCREEARKYVQATYFGMEHYDSSIPLFAFVGRISRQKGVLLILQSVDLLLRTYTGVRLQFLVGGGWDDSPYSAECKRLQAELSAKHPNNFWGDGSFFLDGDFVNMAADFCLMPSLFEPGGIVQHEFFMWGTPCVAFSTGGLKDSVVEWRADTKTGNGFLFTEYTLEAFQAAVRRAADVFIKYSRGNDDGGYLKLRENARAGVMELDTTVRAWMGEILRMRRSLFVEPPPPGALQAVEFRLDCAHIAGAAVRGARVAVAGDFTQWEPTLELAPVGGGEGPVVQRSGTARLPPGLHAFKFVVDGVWSIHPLLPRATDAAGNENNTVHVHFAAEAAEE